MSDNTIFTIIGILYAAVFGGVCYLTQHFFISEDEIKQKANWPLAKVKDTIVTNILRLSEITLYENQRSEAEALYDTIRIKIDEEKQILYLERRLKILRTLSIINIVLPLIFLLCTIFYLLCKVKVNLFSIAQKQFILLFIVWVLPVIIFFLLLYSAEKCKTQLNALEPRNLQKRDE